MMIKARYFHKINIVFMVILSFLVSNSAYAYDANIPKNLQERDIILLDFIHDQLNIHNVVSSIDRNEIFIAVNVTNDSGKVVSGKTFLLSTTAAAAAPWTKNIILCIYSYSNPLAYIQIPTEKALGYINGNISTLDYLKSWGLTYGSSSKILHTTMVESSADAYVYAYNYRNWNRSNRGKYDQLIAGWHPTGGESRAYIKFDLSNIDPSKVKKAALRLYHFQTAGGSGIDLGIYRVTGPWQEGTDTYHSGRIEKTAAPGEISWVQQPPADSRPIVSFNPGRGLGDWVDVDITPLVKEWLAGMPNYGLVVKSVGYLTRSTPESVYYFASRERRSDLDNPKGKSKAPVLILSENPNVKNAITQPPQKIPDTEITKSTFSCKDRDNEERGCCCFKGTHTYRFGARYVTNVLARFDTGRGLNCRSTVNLDVDRGNGWETVKTVQANSSRRGSERAPIDVLVPVNGMIKGFRLSDGCACCLDSSKITLNANYTGGGFPQPSGFQRALGKPCGTDREFVRSLYQSVLERDLEVSFAPGHGAAHLRSLQNGASREAITKAFFNSPEYRKKQKSNRDFIRDVYQAVLGREPNSAELNRRIGTSRNDFISMIFNSAEYHNITDGCLNNSGGNTATPGITTLPFAEDFSQGAAKWTYPANAEIRQGKIFWNTGKDYNALRLNSSIPMGNIVIEFDGYAETNGFGVHLVNENNSGYIAIFGGWFNSQSGSDVGKAGENRKLVAGKVWQPKKWSHYKVVRSGSRLAGYCNGRLIFDRTVPKQYSGYGWLFFDSWNALIGVDNIRIYRANKTHAQSDGLKNNFFSGTYNVEPTLLAGVYR